MPRRFYGVLYASAGCLADDSSGPHSSKLEAARHIQAEWLMCLDEESTRRAPGIRRIAREYGAEDPRPGSLYSWEIVELTPEEAAEWEASA